MLIAMDHSPEEVLSAFVGNEPRQIKVHRIHLRNHLLMVLLCSFMSTCMLIGYLRILLEPLTFLSVLSSCCYLLLFLFNSYLVLIDIKELKVQKQLINQLLTQDHSCLICSIDHSCISCLDLLKKFRRT